MRTKFYKFGSHLVYLVQAKIHAPATKAVEEEHPNSGFWSQPGIMTDCLNKQTEPAFAAIFSFRKDSPQDARIHGPMQNDFVWQGR